MFVPPAHKKFGEDVQPVAEDAFRLPPVFENSDWLQVAVDEFANVVAPDERHHHDQ